MSPYTNKLETEWVTITEKLVNNHPIDKDELLEIIVDCWETILNESYGPLKFGVNWFPKGQEIGNFLHTLIPLELSKRHPTIWKKGENDKTEKDIMNLNNNNFSIEIKTSTDPTAIKGNACYAKGSEITKKRSGYYLIINYEKVTKENPQPKILWVRLGWLDQEDWRFSNSKGGQGASIKAIAANNKLITLYKDSKRKKKAI